MATYLNTYETSMAYGGPEEGGWYYECGEPVQSIKISELDLDTYLEQISEDEATALREGATKAFSKGLAPTPRKTGYGGYTFMPGQGDETDPHSFHRYYEDNSYCSCFEEHYAESYPQIRPRYE